MKRELKIIFFSLLLALILSSCNKPETPQEVALAFWQSVINNDVAGVVEFSTLANEQGYDAFSRDWKGMIPSWGKIIIEENEARIHTHISTPDAASSEMLDFVTYMVKVEDQWKVDFEHTYKVVTASAAVSDFVDRIARMGTEISKQIEQAGKAVTSEIETLNEQLLQLTESLGSRATLAIEQYGEIMRRHLDALADSIEKAIQDQEQNIDPGDRAIMENTVKELNQSSKKLAQPDMNSIEETGEVIIITRENLDKLDAETFQNYQGLWQEWIDTVNVDLINLFNELSSQVN